MPDLPSGARWPTGRPLTLLLQLRLDDAARFPATASLHGAGWLWFLYDVVEQPWGYKREHRSGSRVLFAAADTPLRRRSAARTPVLPAVAVDMRHVVTYPGSLSASTSLRRDLGGAPVLLNVASAGVCTMCVWRG